MQNSVIDSYKFRCIKQLCSFSSLLIMFDKYVRIAYCVQLCLIFILLLELNITTGIPNPSGMKNPKSNANAIGNSESNSASWSKSDMNAGKYTFNAQQLKNTRRDIVKYVSFTVGGMLLLFLIGGIVGVVVYYVKKKRAT